MKKIFKKCGFICAAMVFLLTFSLDVQAVQIYDAGSDYDYTIDHFEIDVVVNEDNTLNITEQISAYFNVEKHGIFRKIPLKNDVVRLDGTTSGNRAKVSKIQVGEEHSVSTEQGYKVIKIGDADHSFSGARDYEISYLYDLGKDTGKGYDELYFNLIGPEWDTIIFDTTFRITMPKEFDETMLGFSGGEIGSVNSSNINFEVDGTVITGYFDDVLYPGEALTVRLELPEGYFTATGGGWRSMVSLLLIVPFLFLFVSLGVWVKFGRDHKVIDTVEFYPPSGFNSAEIGFLYTGRASKTDVISLLVYLADKGYLKLSETEETSLFSSVKGFKITKLKEYDGCDANERLFLHGLFKNKDAAGEITSADLYDKFYTTVDEIIANLNKKENIDKIIERSSRGKGALVKWMIVLTYLFITVIPVANYDMGNILVAVLFPGIGFSVLIFMVFGIKSLFVKIFGLVWGLGFGGIPWILTVWPALQSDTKYLAAYLAGVVCIAFMIVLSRLMPKRTPYGAEILGKIRGFKNFLETSEKSRLETMVMEDPSYFFHILPYTYVLGISDLWIEKFETIALRAPDWYRGSSDFHAASFGRFMNSTMYSSFSDMSSSSSSSSSSGGSSGGGSSGGGSGGGGGGSW